MGTGNASSGPEVVEGWLGLRTFGDPKLEVLRREVVRYHGALLKGQHPHWLTLLGVSGTGKTHCARALWAEIRRYCPWNSDRCEYCPGFVYWPDLVDRMRGGEFYGFYHDMKRWPYLVLDDIGSERDPSGFAIDKLTTLLGCRGGRWTVLTGNLSMAQIEALDVRIASRLHRDGSRVLEVTAMDYAFRVP